MASLRKDIMIDAPPAEVWAAVRDVGAVHRRLAAGFVVDTRLEQDARVVTFDSGDVVLERIVDVDDQARRLAYAACSERLLHHHATMQVFDGENGGTRIVWVTDVLPHGAAAVIAPLVEKGARAIQRTLGRGGGSNA